MFVGPENALPIGIHQNIPHFWNWYLFITMVNKCALTLNEPPRVKGKVTPKALLPIAVDTKKWKKTLHFLF